MWSQLKESLKSEISLPTLTPQTAILGFSDSTNDRVLINHILLIFKLHIFKSREKGNLSIIRLINDIKNIKRTENFLSSSNVHKTKLYNEKWGKTNGTLPI